MELDEYFGLQASVAAKLDSHLLREISRHLDGIRASGSTLWVLGNGGSSATASHAVADFTKTSTANGLSPIRAAALSEFVSLVTAFSNDVSFEHSLGNALALYAKPGDSVLIISVSGKSPNLIYAAEVAKKLGLGLISIVGERGTALAQISDYGLVVPSGDYQIVENIHLEVIHWLVKVLS